MGQFKRASQPTPGPLRNLALVPRVSRAQKLDALTSMANIAGCLFCECYQCRT